MPPETAVYAYTTIKLEEYYRRTVRILILFSSMYAVQVHRNCI